MYKIASTLMVLLLMSVGSYALDVKTIESIKTTLREIQKTDQEARKIIAEKSKSLAPSGPEIAALWEKQAALDAENQQIVAKLLGQYGWPSVSDFGSIGPAQAIFLVIQHADLDYQKKYFEMVKFATSNGNLDKASFALLQDRILMREGKKQMYGSQVIRDSKTGEMIFFDIEDEKNVDMRRAEMGLGPLSEYAKFFGFEYKPDSGE